MKLVKRRGEEGLTLTEMLIALGITTLMTATIAAALFAGLRTNATAQNRLEEANGANKFSLFFAPDVQNGTAIAATGATESAAACGAAAQSVDLLVTTSATSSVSYYRGTGADASKLYRRTCTAGAADSPALLVRYLIGAPQFSCRDTSGAIVGCANWASVTAVFSQRAPLDPNPYQTTLQASRRG
jgi:hypothetical protein